MNNRVQIEMTLEELAVLMSLSDVQGASVFGVGYDPLTQRLRVGIECTQLTVPNYYGHEPPIVRPVMELNHTDTATFRRLVWEDELTKFVRPPQPQVP